MATDSAELDWRKEGELQQENMLTICENRLYAESSLFLLTISNMSHSRDFNFSSLSICKIAEESPW